MVLLFFRWTGSEVLLLEQSPFLEGARDFTGHPVDDERLLLGHRNGGSSNDPFVFRILSLDGDTLVRGPAIERPAPALFEGLDAAEPSAEPGALAAPNAGTYGETQPCANEKAYEEPDNEPVKSAVAGALAGPNPSAFGSADAVAEQRADARP